MSISNDVYLPRLNQSVVRAALDTLVKNGINMQVDPNFSFIQGSGGYLKASLEVYCLPNWVHAGKSIQTGFELTINDVEPTQKIEGVSGFNKLVCVDLDMSAPAGGFIGACFAAALAQAGRGLFIDGESGEKVLEPLKVYMPKASEIKILNEMEVDAEEFTAW